MRRIGISPCRKDALRGFAPRSARPNNAEGKETQRRMKTERISELLIACLRWEMTGTPVEASPLTADECAALCTLAETHDAAHTVWRALKDSAAFSECSACDAVRRMERAAHRCEYRFLLLQTTLARATAALSAAGIDHVPLKGAVLRPLWTHPVGRLSCDVDILVREQDLARAVDTLLSALKAEQRGQSGHDISLFTSDNVHIELHFSLLEEEIPLPSDALLADPFAFCTGDGHAKVMPDAYLYLYHVTHVAKHVLNGGCGVRPVLDTWVLCHRTAPDVEGRARLLREGGLDRFAACVQTLAAVWIDGATPTDESDSLGAFVLRGGVYGSDDGRSGVHAGREGRVRYALSRLFLPLSVMRRYYPVLQRHPYLLPVLWLWRPLTLVFGRGGKERRRALRQAQSVDTAAWGL